MLAYKKLEFFTLFPHCILSLYDPTYFQDQKKVFTPTTVTFLSYYIQWPVGHSA